MDAGEGGAGDLDSGLEGVGAVVVGAVDSLVDADTLKALAGKSRILGESNGDGLIPGEAAGFGLLVSERLRNSLDLPAVEILGLSLADEPNHFMQTERRRHHPRVDSAKVPALVRSIGDGWANVQYMDTTPRMRIAAKRTSLEDS